MGFLIYWLPWVIQRRPKTAVIAGLVGVLIVAYERWQIVPADTGWTLAAGFAVNAVLSAVFGLLATIRKIDRVGLLVLAGKLAAAAVIGLALLGASAPMVHARQYYALGGVTVKAAGSEAFSDIDITQLVVVPQETARNKARQVIGQYGSQFSIGKFYLQKFKGDLVYAAVLEPTGLFTQMSAGASPGYVVVSATDQSAPAKLVPGFSFKYTEDGYWTHWLPRYVRSQFPGKVFSEFSFELDETGRPFWVGSAGHYAIGVGAVKIDSVIVVDPQTGEATLYPLDRIPEWIEQAVPEDVASAYARWWGEYELGWWNSVITQRGVKVLTEVTSAGRSMVGVNGADGKFRYFSGMTSPNKSDTSLIGYMVIDSRTGEMTFHQVPGISSEENIARVVENEFKAQKYSAGYPLPYNVYGRFTWVVPVLDSPGNGQLMSLSLVSADAATVSSGKNVQEALRQFKARMSGVTGAGPTDTARLVKVEGTVARISPATDQGTSMYYLILTAMPGKVFTAPLGMSPYLPVTKPDDKVALEYADTNETLIPVTAFRNLNLTP